MRAACYTFNKSIECRRTRMSREKKSMRLKATYNGETKNPLLYQIHFALQCKLEWSNEFQFFFLFYVLFDKLFNCSCRFENLFQHACAERRLESIPNRRYRQINMIKTNKKSSFIIRSLCCCFSFKL